MLVFFDHQPRPHAIEQLVLSLTRLPARSASTVSTSSVRRPATRARRRRASAGLARAAAQVAEVQAVKRGGGRRRGSDGGQGRHGAASSLAARPSRTGGVSAGGEGGRSVARTAPASTRPVRHRPQPRPRQSRGDAQMRACAGSSILPRPAADDALAGAGCVGQGLHQAVSDALTAAVVGHGQRHLGLVAAGVADEARLAEQPGAAGVPCRPPPRRRGGCRQRRSSGAADHSNRR